MVELRSLRRVTRIVSPSPEPSPTISRVTSDEDDEGGGDDDESGAGGLEMSAPVAAPAPLPARVVASDPPTGARAGAKRKYERKTWRRRGEPVVNVLDEPGLRALLCAAMAIGRPDDLVFNKGRRRVANLQVYVS